MKRVVLAIVPIALAACQQSDTGGNDMDTVETEGTVAPATTPSAPPPESTTTVGIPEFGIPVALQGNWGMVAADCTSTRGDAKGLLRISATTLTFYESVGRLGAVKERSESSIRADYAFTGEGMEWTRDVSLSVAGDTLTRLDRGGDEPGGPYTYTKCAG